jgi:predicted ATPase
LTSVGVGVSQVLPTLVLFLLAPNNSILLIEQPELHLHPKVQSILGDFFLGMAECGKQCIVETHSEYIVNRLRRRIVETPGKRILDKIKIYFVEKEKAESQFREVQPNEYGSIHDWPKGFFDEVDREASRILDAQMNKRRQTS